MKEKRFRKGQGLSFNVIILAVLALIVLFVLIYIFSSQSGKSINTLSSCIGKGGKCVKEEKECEKIGFISTDVKCPATEKPFCCIKVFESK